MAKKNVFSNLFNMRLTKTDKKVLKGVAIGVGVLALVGASGKIAKRL